MTCHEVPFQYQYRKKSCKLWVCNTDIDDSVYFGGNAHCIDRWGPRSYLYFETIMRAAILVGSTRTARAHWHWLKPIDRCSPRIKRIDLRVNLLEELGRNGTITIAHKSNKVMSADIFTKYLGIVAFRGIMAQPKEYRRKARHLKIWGGHFYTVSFVDRKDK